MALCLFLCRPTSSFATDCHCPTLRHPQSPHPMRGAVRQIVPVRSSGTTNLPRTTKRNRNLLWISSLCLKKIGTQSLYGSLRPSEATGFVEQRNCPFHVQSKARNKIVELSLGLLNNFFNLYGSGSRPYLTLYNFHQPLSPGDTVDNIRQGGSGPLNLSHAVLIATRLPRKKIDECMSEDLFLDETLRITDWQGVARIGNPPLAISKNVRTLTTLSSYSSTSSICTPASYQRYRFVICN